MPNSIITDIGLTKVRNAAGSASLVAISEVALGDGNGANYAPAYNQAALKNERARVPIDSRAKIGVDSWWIRAAFPPETPVFTVREMAFFDDAGACIAIWADPAAAIRQTGGFTYLIDHVLNFSRVDGVVVVDAPDNELFDHAIQNLETHAIIADEQVKQRLLIRTLTAQFEGQEA